MIQESPIALATRPVATIALPHLVGRLACEISHLTEIASALQAAVRFDGSFDPGDGGLMRSAQNLDLMTQKLDALHCFVETLRESVPHEWHVDPVAVTDGIKLASVRDHLASGRLSVAVPAELDLF